MGKTRTSPTKASRPVTRSISKARRKPITKKAKTLLYYSDRANDTEMLDN